MVDWLSIRLEVDSMGGLMRVWYNIGVSVALIFSNVGSASGQEASEVCLREAAQEDCLATCAPLCRSDSAFLEANFDLCVDENWFSRDPVAEGVSDAAVCSHQFSAANPASGYALESELDATASPEPEAPGALVPGGDPCNGLTDVFEIAECLNKQDTPSCSPKPRELRERTSLLVEEINLQMSEYSDLLELDLATVENQQALCNFSRAQLREFYTDAIEDPDVFHRLVARSNDISACTGEWEEWLANFNPETGASALPDNLVRAMKSNMKQLRPQLQNMETGLVRLEQAAPQILNLARLHVLECPAPPEDAPTSD